MDRGCESQQRCRNGEIWLEMVFVKFDRTIIGAEEDPEGRFHKETVLEFGVYRLSLGWISMLPRISKPHSAVEPVSGSKHSDIASQDMLLIKLGAPKASFTRYRCRGMLWHLKKNVFPCQ